MKKLINAVTIMILFAAIFSFTGCAGYNFTDSEKLKRPEIEPKSYGFLLTGKVLKDVSYINIYRETDDGLTKTVECLGLLLPSSFDSLNETYAFEDSSVVNTDGKKYRYMTKYCYNNGKFDETGWTEPLSALNPLLGIDRTMDIDGIVFSYDDKETTDKTLRLSDTITKPYPFTNVCLLVEALNEIVEETPLENKITYEVESTQAIVIEESQTAFILPETLPDTLLDRPIRIKGIIAQYEERDPLSEAEIKPVKRVLFSEIAEFTLMNSKGKSIADNRITVKSAGGKAGYNL